MDQTTKICRIVGESIFKIGQPVAAGGSSSTASASIDFQSYVSEGSFTFTNAVVDNTGQNKKKSSQYGQDSVTASFTFFAVDDDDVDNPLTILRRAKAKKLAVPIYFKESDSTFADGFDGDMICETDEVPIPGENEVKVVCSLYPCNVHRVWKRLSEDWPETIGEGG